MGLANITLENINMWQTPASVMLFLQCCLLLLAALSLATDQQVKVADQAFWEYFEKVFNDPNGFPQAFKSSKKGKGGITFDDLNYLRTYKKSPSMHQILALIGHKSLQQRFNGNSKADSGFAFKQLTWASKLIEYTAHVWRCYKAEMPKNYVNTMSQVDAASKEIIKAIIEKQQEINEHAANQKKQEKLGQSAKDSSKLPNPDHATHIPEVITEVPNKTALEESFADLNPSTEENVNQEEDHKSHESNEAKSSKGGSPAPITTTQPQFNPNASALEQPLQTGQPDSSLQGPNTASSNAPTGEKTSALEIAGYTGASIFGAGALVAAGVLIYRKIKANKLAAAAA